MKDYKIEVCMTPHYWDNSTDPFFWVIYEFRNKCWVNTGTCGWEKTPEDAWLKATSEFCILVNE